MEAQTIDDGRLKALVRQAQEGDRAAFGEVYDLCFSAVYRYVAFRLPPEAAEDVAAALLAATLAGKPGVHRLASARMQGAQRR